MEDSAVKKIRIVSPAKSIDELLVKEAKKRLEDRGYQVSVSNNALGIHDYFSGSDEDRLNDFQQALDDPELDVILCARGGYGSVRIIDRLDFTAFKKHPKLILGYSDITVFHSRMHNLGFASGHTTAPLNFNENTDDSVQSLFNLIDGKKNEYKIKGHELNKAGVAETEIVGGNLSIITSLIGTNDDIDMNGKILFVEEVGEAVYSIDRMFYSLQKSGKLDGLKGLIVGGMTGIKDSAVPFGEGVEAVIRHHVDHLNFPLCFNFPAGHVDDNRAILLNSTARLEVKADSVCFSQ